MNQKPRLGRMIVLYWLGTLLFLVPSFLQAAPPEDSVDTQTVEIAIYGGTPAGIAAALAGGEMGHDVLLIEPYRRIGGLVTNGLSHADFRTFEGITGTYLEFTKRIQAYYDKKYGEGSPQAECFRGTHAEPHVNQLVFEQMLAEQKSVRILTQHQLLGVTLLNRSEPHPRIESVRVRDAEGQEHDIHAQMFIDASYEGDLMARAGITYRVGREGQSEYNEPLAPEQPDHEVQGYNFRLVMTQVPENRVPVTAPAGYRREDFLKLLPLFEAKKLKSVFCSPSGGIYKYQPPALPNEKYDINDVSRGLVRLSLPQINNPWPDGNEQVRQELFHEHLKHNIGMLYFLQTDEDVPAEIQKEALAWGLCRDEFTDNASLPEQLYIREARRMVGLSVFTQKQTDHAPNDARAVLIQDSIAMGDYGPNCHGTGHAGSRFGGKHEGEFYQRVSPYQIPYSVLVPQRCENLLVPVACSASHVGFCALRLEPIWTGLGQASGVAASLAIAEKIPVQKVEPLKIQKRLHQRGAATIYMSDVLPDSPDFAAVQWWGTLGGFHGLAPAPAEQGERGKHLFGQYYHAFPNHAAELDKPLDEKLHSHWRKLAEAEGLDTRSFEESATRGDYLRQLYQAFQKQSEKK